MASAAPAVGAHRTREKSDEDSVVTPECLKDLLRFIASRSTGYRARTLDQRFEIIEKMCLHLFARDYEVQTIDNRDGKLCSHYPANIIIIEREHCTHLPSSKSGKLNCVKKLSELFRASRVARCRARFIVPVIVFKNKNICRSATLSTVAELYGRSGMEWFFSGPVAPQASSEPSEKGSKSDKATEAQESNTSSEWVLFSQAREADAQLLAVLSVKLICDLMVEMRKTKMGLIVSSSEKADGGQLYSNFHLASIPFPGCEFFKEYKDRGRRAEGMMFHWSMPANDAQLSVPSPLPQSVGIDFKLYQSWDLVKLTQNYLKLLLHFLQYEEGGVLVHCISGWDRTPLFISLLRLSLWADDLVHKSLNTAEILYLTLAYDWLMFGHQFEDRLKKGEEIFYFCFDFLKHITTDNYSVSASSTPSTPTTATTTTTDTLDQSNTTTTDRNSFDQSNATTITSSSFDRSNTAASITRSSVSFPTGNHNLITMETGSQYYQKDLSDSLRKVSLSSIDGRCLYHPSVLRQSPSPISEHSFPKFASLGLRAQRLMSIRELFINIYKTAIPATQPSTQGGVLDWWSRLMSGTAPKA